MTYSGLFIEILFNEKTRIMEIRRNGKPIFYDYYSKFDSSPVGLKRFLERLNLYVTISDKLNV